MDQRRARDADRDQAVEAIEAAFVDGQLTASDRDLRVERALTAHTMSELAALIADLQVPAELRPAPPVEYAATGTRSDRATARQVLTAVPRRYVAVVGLAAVMALVIPMVVWLVAVFDPSVNADQGTSPGLRDTAAAGASEVASPAEPEPTFALSPDDVRTFFTAYEEQFDTLDAYEVDFYETWVSVQVPVRGSRPRFESWAFDGSFSRLADARAVTSGARLIGLGDIDLEAMFANLRRAKRTLGVEDPERVYVLVHTWDERPTVNLYVSNSYGESGYLKTSLGGKVIRAYGFDA